VIRSLSSVAPFSHTLLYVFCLCIIVIYPGNNNGVDDDDQECHVIQGGMQIIARETDDLNNTIASILTKIEDAMTNDELLGDDIPTVTNVTYIGTSQEEVENNSTIILPPILPPLNSIPETDADDDDNGNMIIGLTASMAFLAFLFFLLWRKKRKVATTSRFLAVADDGFKPLHGTGDPPGSFHYGIYHYFPTGEHYLSTNCHDCHETRDSGDYGGGGPPAITAVLSDDDYYGRLIAANSKDIGRGTSAMNVHRCTSSTCHLCLPSKNNVEIVKVKNPIVDTYDL
jgi:LPXTG-motif cell wall-anchored protein